MAWAAVRTKDSFFQSLVRRLVPRLGTQKAIWAVAHRLSRVIWVMLHRQERYRELGPLGGNPKSIQARLHKMVRQLTSLGYQIVAPTEA